MNPDSSEAIINLSSRFMTELSVRDFSNNYLSDIPQFALTLNTSREGCKRCKHKSLVHFGLPRASPRNLVSCFPPEQSSLFGQSLFKKEEE